MYNLSVMLVKTGIQNAKNEYPDRHFTWWMTDLSPA
jgi:hypothetical protein